MQCRAITLTFMALTAATLSACMAPSLETYEPERPEHWSTQTPELTQNADIKDLQNWWVDFKDPALDELVQIALINSPERAAAQARILEARGITRSSQSSLYPQIGASASGGRGDTAVSSTDSFYDAGFDASFELDVFGQTRARTAADRESLSIAEAKYHDISLTMIADIARYYIQFRAAQKQIDIARKNLGIQEETLNVVNALFEAGEITSLEVERASALVSATRASVPAFTALADTARLRLSVLTGSLPAELSALLDKPAEIPAPEIRPVLLAPSQALSVRPDIRAAQANLERTGNLADAAFRDLFPKINLTSFFGVTETALISAKTIWDVAANAAVRLLDFGRLEGQIDASRAREKEAFALYRLSVIEAVVEVETALSDYANIDKQRADLEQSFISAAKALDLSRRLYNEGEIAFIDLLDAQREVNSAESSLVNAQAAQAESLVRLYKSLGVY